MPRLPLRFTFLSLALAHAVPAALTPEKLRVEYLEHPLGLDVPQPWLSWIVAAPERGARQTAYQVLAASSEAALRADRGDIWDSGKVMSDATAQVAYAGAPLASGQRVWWKVRGWDGADVPSAWSAPATWEMGLLAASDWHGQWIARTTFTGEAQPLPLLRRSFTLDRDVRRARLYITGLGYFEATINGQRVGDHLLDPGYTRYDRRVLYLTHDVTS